MSDDLEGQDRVIAEVRDLVDAWRGFRLGPAIAPYPDDEPRYEPQVDGEHALTETSKTLLRHGFRPDPHELGSPPRSVTFKYWPHQRRAVETFIYLYEVRRIRRTEKLWELCGAEPLGPQRDPWAKLGAQLATGSGKTKVMSLLVAWSYLNAVADPKNSLGLGKHALIVAPGLFVRDRLLADFQPPGRDARASVFFTDPVVPPRARATLGSVGLRSDDVPSPARFVARCVVVANYHQLLRESEAMLAPTGKNREQLGLDLLFASADPSKLEDLDSPLVERFDASRGLLVINDEAHHVGDEPAHAAFEQKAKQKATGPTDAEAMAWIRSIRRLHGSAVRGGRVALQVDLSATLFEEQGMAKKPSKRKGASDARSVRPQQLFRHTAVRYDLVHAIRDGIVKQPILERIGVTNRATGEREDVVREGQPNAWEKYRNLVVTGVQRWKKVRAQLVEEDDRRKPILFLLCENQNEAREIANFLRYGEADREDLTGKRRVTGFPDPDGGAPLFVESDSNSEPASTVVEIHIGEREERDDKAWGAVRQIVNEIDRDEVVGEDGVRRPNRFNLVVSVMMLKEGWDVRNVKVIAPLRPCDSRTLTEQILGRGLRKMHAPIIEEDGSAKMRAEDLYVMEHPSFRAILEQIEDILEAKDSDDIQHTPDYVGILPKPEVAEREAFDVRLVRFDGLSRITRSWYDDFKIAQVPVLSPRLASPGLARCLKWRSGRGCARRSEGKARAWSSGSSKAGPSAISTR
jgi:type III restriction enzyme